MTYRQDDDFARSYSYYSQEYKNSYYSKQLTDYKTKYTKLKKEVAAAKEEAERQNENKKNILRIKEKIKLDKISSINEIINGFFKLESYREAFAHVDNMNKDRDLYLAQLACEMEEQINEDLSLKIQDKNGEFYIVLLEVYQALKPESSDLYLTRCTTAINAISEAIEEATDEDVINELKEQRLCFYIKLHLHYRHLPESIIDENELVNELVIVKLLTSSDEIGLPLEHGISFEQTVARLAIDYSRNQKMNKNRPNKNELIQDFDQLIALENDENKKREIPKKLKLLSDAIDRIENEKQALTEENKKLKSQNVSFHDSLNKKTGKKILLKNSLRIMENELAIMESNLHNSYQENINLDMKYDNITDENKKLNEVCAKLNETKVQLSSQISKLEIEVNQKNKSIEKLQTDLKLMQSEIVTKTIRILREIQVNIYTHPWHTGMFGGKTVFKIGEMEKDVLVTETAKKILDIMQAFWDAKKKQNVQHVDLDVEAKKCLNEIYTVADRGRKRNVFYRFFFRQSASSRTQYEEYQKKVLEI
ncbi:MAG: hypothetical protein A3F11_11265 [Gammaproteobacteria bacterium RIFCSPHIGHO2_12_FULL_37_14]|nr:MAG: hypothetical protein A3F11_11265 [Gammaproteobacteria bacterium RIFCSPHIGHO2_12_FULL_37_14]